MPISEKDKEYINNLRRQIEVANHRDVGFNVSRHDDGMDALRDSSEADEVKNENTPIYDDNDNDYSLFDNTKSIVADDASLQYDEHTLGFKDDSDSPDIFSDDETIDNANSSSSSYSGDVNNEDIFSDIDDDAMSLDDMIEQLTHIRSIYGNIPCMIHCNGENSNVSFLQASNDGNDVRICSR
jgi:hypothetical protein